MKCSTLTRFVHGGLTLLVLAACQDAPSPADPGVDDPLFSVWEGKSDKHLRVLTWNTYLGGSTGPLFTLNFSNIPAVVEAVNGFWADVQASDIPARAGAVVDEIEDKRPHVVSLQEVVQFAVIDGTTGQPIGGIDILAAIKGHIAMRGLPYEVVAAQENTSSALPLETDFSRLLFFTDRVVTLRRTDVVVTDVDQGSYQANVQLGPVTLKRGYIRASLDFDGDPFHVVNTHLEIQSLAPVQAAQADELLNVVMAGLDGITVLTGDLNSDAEAAPDAPSWTPTYGLLLDAGFEDAWDKSRKRRKDPGYTCCQDNDLRNGPSLLDERIDFMLVRASSDGHSRRSTKGKIHMEILGEEQEDRVGAEGLWPADHAGLAGIFRIRAKSGKSDKSTKSGKSGKR